MAIPVGEGFLELRGGFLEGLLRGRVGEVVLPPIHCRPHSQPLDLAHEDRKMAVSAFIEIRWTELEEIDNQLPVRLRGYERLSRGASAYVILRWLLQCRQGVERFRH